MACNTLLMVALAFLVLETICVYSSMDIFVLSGQSNMSGRGGVVNSTITPANLTWDHVVPKQCRPNRSIYRLDAHLNWTRAHEPLHADIDTKKVCGVGPGMAFANAMLKHYPQPKKAALGLVPCAIGGTPIKEWERGSLLYNNMIARTKIALQSTHSAVLRALLWYQGESDAESESTADIYKENVERFFNNVRSDLQHPDLLIIQVAITMESEETNVLVEKVRQAQLSVSLPNVYTVDANGLPLKEDKLHLTTEGQVQLGKKLAKECIKHLNLEIKEL